MVFYLKYRSKKIDELDLSSVRESLSHIVSSGNIPHAFLFSGPKGTGKTSAARILAKIINCENRNKKTIEPCNRCDQCKTIDSGSNIDVLELDAASNRGIDDIRSLRDAVKLSPVKAKAKVYVIDEAHMLTTEASNALLKTLEEPPEHVYFILATTNPEKLIDTIRSRTTEIKFKKAGSDEILRSLKRVVKGESIKTEDGALDLIVKAAGGSFRDAHKLLEQLSSGGKKLSEKTISETLRTTDSDMIEKFLELISQEDIKSLIAFVEDMAGKGTDIKGFLLETLDLLKKMLLSNYGLTEVENKYFDKPQLLLLIETFDDVYRKTGSTAIEELPLELALVGLCEEDNSQGSGGDIEEDNEGTSEAKDTKTKKINESKHKLNGKSSNGKVNLSNGKKLNGTLNGNHLDEDLWKQVLLSIRPKNSSTEALLRAAKPLDLNGDILTVGVFYNFHKERLEEHAHRTILEDTLCELMGRNIRILCKLTEPPRKHELVEVENNTDNKEAEDIEDKSSNHNDKTLTTNEDDDIVKIAEQIFG
ncbi:DNA polymerase III subunit gamma/tau [Candidatus Woesebacteria bacterium]|nr:DNA polymerase III subunit gamma/tau [Candidatus Woesebacteria bacterium]